MTDRRPIRSPGAARREEEHFERLRQRGVSGDMHERAVGEERSVQRREGTVLPRGVPRKVTPGELAGWARSGGLGEAGRLHALGQAGERRQPGCVAPVHEHDAWAAPRADDRKRRDVAERERREAGGGRRKVRRGDGSDAGEAPRLLLRRRKAERGEPCDRPLADLPEPGGRARGTVARERLEVLDVGFRHATGTASRIQS